MNYNILLDEAVKQNIRIIENACFESNADGLINGNIIGLNKNMHTSAQKACVLAEEMGHYYTTSGDIIELTTTINRKQEYRARLWAYDKVIGLGGLISSYEAGCQSTYEMAEYLNITEPFLKEALQCYQKKYGISTNFGNYMIVFEPSLEIKKLP